MSDFLAEARVIVRPDTTRFRAELLTAVATATRTPVPVTVTPVVVGGAQGFTQVASQAAVASTAVNSLAASQLRAGATAEKTSNQLKDQAKTLGNIERAAIASAAGMTGLRGAVLTAGGAFIAATVAIQAFGRSVQSAAQLETNLNVFRVTAGATADEMERVSETAKALGRDLSLPGVTASDAAETFLTLSKAGLSVQDSLAGARGTLQLAVAAQIGFSEAAQLTASALNAFGLSGDNAVAIADTLTNAANASQASIGDMGIALRQSAAIADLAGFSFGETATFLTQLAQAGLAGSDAGTSFRVAIQRLIAPTAKARAILNDLNIDLRDTAGNLRPEAFFELGDALERMGRAQGDAARQTIFGNDASRAAAFFARINAEAFREQEAALNEAGAAAEVAGARNEGFAGSVENLKNQVTALGIEIGDASIPLLGVAADGAALFFGALATQIGETREVFADIGDDVERFAGLLKESFDQGGTAGFFEDVGEGASLLKGDFDRAALAITDFLGATDGIPSRAGLAATTVKKLSDEEARLAEAIHETHRPFETQNDDLRDTVTAAEAAVGAIARLTGQIAGLEEGVTRARISGDQGTELDLLEEERDRLQKLLAIQENIVAEGGAGAATARRNIREQILPQLESVGNEIEALISEQVVESQRIADDAERARDDRDQNLIDAIGVRESARQNAVIAAAATEGAKDDLKANIALRNFYRSVIAEIKRTVTDAKTAAEAVASAAADLARADQAIKDARRALRQERREAREARGEGTDLDIELASITGAEQREIALRKKRIKQLQDQIKHEQGNTLLIKRLRNEIARQKQAIKELQEEEKEAAAQEEEGRSAQQVLFEALQKQQGFAANLLGNLIPTNATAGLVGGTVPSPQASIEVSQAKAAGMAQFGPTAGQMNSEIDILRQILMELRQANQGSSHPEAKYERATGSSVMDVQ